MIVYRLASGKYSNDLTGTGAKMYGGRWNSVGINIVYATEHISLSVLEILVHMRSFREPFDYRLVTIEIPEAENLLTTLDTGKLKTNWKDDIAYTQFIGDEFLKAKQSLALKVPSAIIEPEYNLLLNPLHPDAGKIKIRSSKVFIFDKRLYLKDE